MKLNEIFRCMLEHPIATVIVLGCVTNGTVRIISAAKGNEVSPNTVITIGKQAKPEEE